MTLIFGVNSGWDGFISPVMRGQAPPVEPDLGTLCPVSTTFKRVKTKESPQNP